jgi:hypothetical protein
MTEHDWDFPMAVNRRCQGCGKTDAEIGGPPEAPCLGRQTIEELSTIHTLSPTTSEIDRKWGDHVTIRPPSPARPLYEPRMPPEIARAILAVAKEVQRLGKDEENKFAKFRYVSVDKFYEEIGPLMAKHGLFDFAQEVSAEIEARETTDEGGKLRRSLWLTSEYDVMLYHESGAEFGPIRRTMMVLATGPQAFGSGVSYVEKYFLRALFKVPTGEQDADAEAQEGVPERSGTQLRRQAWTPKVAPSKASSPTGDVARAIIIRMRHEIKNAGYIEELNERGIFGPSALSDHDLIVAQRGGEELWRDLVNRDAARRLELSSAQAEGMEGVL